MSVSEERSLAEMSVDYSEDQQVVDAKNAEEQMEEQPDAKNAAEQMEEQPDTKKAAEQMQEQPDAKNAAEQMEEQPDAKNAAEQMEEQQDAKNAETEQPDTKNAEDEEQLDAKNAEKEQLDASAQQGERDAENEQKKQLAGNEQNENQGVHEVEEKQIEAAGNSGGSSEEFSALPLCGSTSEGKCLEEVSASEVSLPVIEEITLEKTGLKRKAETELGRGGLPGYAEIALHLFSVDVKEAKEKGKSPLLLVLGPPAPGQLNRQPLQFKFYADADPRNVLPFGFPTTGPYAPTWIDGSSTPGKKIEDLRVKLTISRAQAAFLEHVEEWTKVQIQQCASQIWRGNGIPNFATTISEQASGPQCSVKLNMRTNIEGWTDPLTKFHIIESDGNEVAAQGWDEVRAFHDKYKAFAGAQCRLRLSISSIWTMPSRQYGLRIVCTDCILWPAVAQKSASDAGHAEGRPDWF